MMNTRVPEDVLAPLRDLSPVKVLAVTIPGEANALPAAEIAARARSMGFAASPVRSVRSAILEAAAVPDARVLVCGSLYLAGDVLARNGTLPD